MSFNDGWKLIIAIAFPLAFGQALPLALGHGIVWPCPTSELIATAINAAFATAGAAALALGGLGVFCLPLALGFASGAGVAVPVL